MQEAVTEPETHQYPSNRGREDFRGAVRDFYERRFDVDARPRARDHPGDRREGGDLQPQPRLPRPRRLRAGGRPGYPVYTGGPWLAGAEPVLMALEPELGFVPDLDAIDEEVARRRS